MAKPEKEKCPKCASSDCAVATDKSNKHYCNKCQNIWVPGLSGLNRIDVQLKNALQENVDLKRELDKTRKELAALKAMHEPEETRPSAEGDIFS